MSRVLDNWISGYLDIHPDCESPKKFLAWSAISTIAGALQRTAFMPWGAETFYPNFYIILVAPPGRCRKGTAMKLARRLLGELEIPIAASSTSRKGFIQDLMDALTTSDGANGSTVMHHSLTVFSEELTVFFSGHDSGQLITDMTDLYDCKDNWSYRTQLDGILSIDNVYVNMVGATTPDLVRHVLPTASAHGGGLTSRMIFIYEDKPMPRVPYSGFIETPMGQMMLQGLQHDLKQIHNLSGAFQLSTGYHQLYYKWYTEMADDCPFDPQRFNGYWSRRATHLRKLSVIMSAARSNEMIVREEDFIDAQALLEDTEVKMNRVFGSKGRSKESEILAPIMEFIVKCETVTFSELLAKFIRETNKKELTDIVNSLREIRFASVTKKGDDYQIKYLG